MHRCAASVAAPAVAPATPARRVAVAALAVFACLLAAAPAPAQQKGSLLDIGDSLGVGSDPPLRQLLPGWDVLADVKKDRTTAQGMEILDQVAQSGPLPGALVIQLGTNDDARATSAFRAAIQHTLKLAGAQRCVVWVNVHRPPLNGLNWSSLNQVLEEQAAQSPNLAVVDWDGMVQSGQAQLAGDDVHATPQGYRARAAAIAQALKGGCAAAAAAAPATTPGKIGKSHTLTVKPRAPRKAQAKKKKPPKPAATTPETTPTPAKPKIKVYVPATPASTKTEASKSGGSSSTPYLVVGAVAGVLLAGIGALLWGSARNLRRRAS